MSCLPSAEHPSITETDSEESTFRSHFNIRIHPWTAEAMVEAAARRRLSVTGLVRHAVAHYLLESGVLSPEEKERVQRSWHLSEKGAPLSAATAAANPAPGEG
jgi:hypothetical protein